LPSSYSKFTICIADNVIASDNFISTLAGLKLVFEALLALHRKLSRKNSQTLMGVGCPVTPGFAIRKVITAYNNPTLTTQ